MGQLIGLEQLLGSEQLFGAKQLFRTIDWGRAVGWGRAVIFYPCVSFVVWSCHFLSARVIVCLRVSFVVCACHFSLTVGSPTKGSSGLFSSRGSGWRRGLDPAGSGVQSLPSAVPKLVFCTRLMKY